MARLTGVDPGVARASAAATPGCSPAVLSAGMVAENAQGTRRIYHLQEEGLRAVQAYLEGVWGQAAQRFRLLAENTYPGPGS